jgi:ADP-ribose pyrophosphatase YjhB (NUDIX family)
MPFTRIELAIMAIVDHELCVLLAQRSEAPAAGRWAMPGGVLRIDLDASLDQAAQRVLHERVGIATAPLRQIRATGGPDRDPRAPWTLSVIYRVLLVAGDIVPIAGKRITSLQWRPVRAAAVDTELAFDHAAILSSDLAVMESEIDRLDLPYGLLPPEFTLGDLQAGCESVLGRPLDKSSFRRRIADLKTLQPVIGATRRGAFRPAQLYRRV